MNISFDTILSWLTTDSIQSSIVGKPPAEMTIASLFCPISTGFYYFTGSSLPENITSSLVMVGESFDQDTMGDNSIVIVSDNPQRVFYRLLSDTFGAQSTGQISHTATLHPEAVIGKNVQIEEYAIIGRCTIGDDVIIRAHCTIHDNTTIGNRTEIETHSAIGARGMAWIWSKDQTHRIVQPQLGGAHIGPDCILGAHSVIVRGSLSENTRIGEGSILAPGCRIGHGTIIGRFAHLANNVITGGNAQIGDYSFIGSGAVLRVRVQLHPNTVVGAGAVVVKSTTEAHTTLTGVPAKPRPTKASPHGMPEPRR